MRALIRRRVAAAKATRGGSLIARALPSGAVVLSILAFSGYAMGLVRDRLFAHTFGAGSDLDAYNAAFILPELALDVLVAGGLVAPFVPLFIGLKGEAAEAADAFGRTVLTLAVGVMSVTAAILFIVAPQTIQIIAPGFTGEQRDLYVGLFRVMCLTPVIFAASIVVGEVLVAERRFLMYGLAPLMYNGGIVVGTFLLSGSIGIYAAAVGAVAGALGHLAIRLVGLRGSSFRPRASLALRTKGLGEFLKLMAPKMVSQPIEPLTFLYFTALASTLAAGSVSSVSFARNFQSVPVSLIGVSFAIAAFPALSAAAAAGDRRAFGRVFAANLASITVFTTAAAIGLFVLSGFVIQLFLAGGAFDAEDISRTTTILAVFALSVPLESLAHLLARGVYATRNTILPTAAALAGFVVIVFSAGALVPVIGLSAVPASYALGMAVKVLILAAALAGRVARLSAGAPRVAAPGLSPLPPARRLRPRLAYDLAGAVAFVALTVGVVAATGQALGGATIAAAPVVTPWAREFPLASHAVPTLPPTPTAPTPSADASAISPTTSPAPTPAPTPTPTPGPFAMDLYEKGDFVGEYKNTWCVPAAMQVSINIMSAGADTTKATQTRLRSLAYSLAPGKTGGVDPEGWALGLTKLGYGNYAVGANKSMTAAVNTVVKAIRLTNRPAGLFVWYGWHSWVVSGFKATADPAVTDEFTVTALYIEDVWYNRLSSIWGYSNPPDTLTPVKVLGQDYKPWKQWSKYPGKDGRYVFVMPVP